MAFLFHFFSFHFLSLFLSLTLTVSFFLFNSFLLFFFSTSSLHYVSVSNSFSFHYYFHFVVRFSYMNIVCCWILFFRFPSFFDLLSVFFFVCLCILVYIHFVVKVKVDGGSAHFTFLFSFCKRRFLFIFFSPFGEYMCYSVSFQLLLLYFYETENWQCAWKCQKLTQCLPCAFSVYYMRHIFRFFPFVSSTYFPPPRFLISFCSDCDKIHYKAKRIAVCECEFVRFVYQKLL